MPWPLRRHDEIREIDEKFEDKSIKVERDKDMRVIPKIEAILLHKSLEDQQTKC